jgi:hypothetical protein
MRNLYDFGLYFKTYYASFLSGSYDRNKVYVRSTDLDRTLQSGNVFLSALYKPNADQKWSYVLDWMPIPIRSNDADTDKVT